MGFGIDSLSKHIDCKWQSGFGGSYLFINKVKIKMMYRHHSIEKCPLKIYCKNAKYRRNSWVVKLWMSSRLWSVNDGKNRRIIIQVSAPRPRRITVNLHNNFFFSSLDFLHFFLKNSYFNIFFSMVLVIMN